MIDGLPLWPMQWRAGTSHLQEPRPRKVISAQPCAMCRPRGLAGRLRGQPGQHPLERAALAHKIDQQSQAVWRQEHFQEPVPVTPARTRRLWERAAGIGAGAGAAFFLRRRDSMVARATSPTASGAR